MKRLREVSIFSLIQGILMVLFPSFFAGTKMARDNEEALLIGIVLIVTGVVIYLIKKVLDKRRAEGNW